MKLLVVDAGSIDRNLLRSHLEPRYGPQIELCDAGSPVEIAAAGSHEAAIDAAVIGRAEQPDSQSQLVDRLAGILPGVPLVVIYPSDEPPTSLEKSADSLVSLIPRHHLALQPVRIEQLTKINLPSDSTALGRAAEASLALDPSFWT